MANIIYLSLKGERQGLISAGCGTKGSIGNKYQINHQDEIFVLQCDHAMSRVHNVVNHPIKFYKPIDKSSPLLNAAITNNEKLSAVFSFYRTATGGGIERFYSIEIHGAYLTNLSFCYPHALTHSDNQPEEVVTLSYMNISWKHLMAGTESYSVWEERIY